MSGSTPLQPALLLLPLLLLLQLQLTAAAAQETVQESALLRASEPPVASAAAYDCAGPSATSDTFLDYEHVVHCAPGLRSSPAAGKVALVLCLLLLLYLLSSTADEFFCPVLQAIVEKYRIPPEVAGVTFLSFGNGSPDVFSNIAAFSSANADIGVTAILGSGLLVTTVITACVGLVSDGQEQLLPRTFARDVSFYFVGVVYLGFVFFDGQVHLLEALGFLGIYFCYVLVVFLDKQLAKCCCLTKWHPSDALYAELDENDEDVMYWSSSSASDKSGTESPSLLPALGLSVASATTQPRHPLLKSSSIPAYDTFAKPYIFSDSESSEPSPRFWSRSLQRKNSVPTPRAKSQLDDGQNMVLQRELDQTFLERTDVHLRRPSSMCVSSMQDSLRRMRRQRRRRKTAWESLESSAHFGPTARRWTRGYHVLSGIEEFPSVREGEDESAMSEEEEERQEAEVKRRAGEELAEADAVEVRQLELEAGLAASVLERTKVRAKRMKRWVLRAARSVYNALERFVWNPFEVFTVFARRLTIPLVDEDTWDKNFAVVCPPFAMLLIGISVFSFSIKDPLFLGTVALIGGVLSGIIECTASPLAPPSGWQLAPYICLAFVMSVIWIMNIANEVLAVLETLGGLFGISDSVLGVSVLAWGNSIGDLVSNMAIARDGFPTMAFAGCFAGPMFNLLIGIGLSLTIAIVSRGTLSMGEPSPLVYLGFGYLLMSLLLNLAAASYDRFRYRAPLCYTLLALYASFAVISVAVVLYYPSE